MYVISRISATFQREYIIALMLVFVNAIYESNDVQQSTKLRYWSQKRHTIFHIILNSSIAG